jgi:peroxiredoxin
VIGVGDALPEVQVLKLDRSAVSLRELAAEGPILLLFYRFDWSST